MLHNWVTDKMIYADIMVIYRKNLGEPDAIRPAVLAKMRKTDFLKN